ncbi:MAG: cupin domain-containing protein [Porticoccaceae bacterium]|jgi:mannose-6-phosphate isomerase-like protein (cupin superfamily)|nr:cupin domain-containing protein [Porticoccaceae bacterium]
MVKASIQRTQPDSEYYFEEGCFITELSNSSDDPDVSVARARVEPGKTTRWHSLEGISERYIILEGQGMVEVADLDPEMVGPGDVVIIPSGQRQRITNSGAVDLIFLAICSPRFDASAYRDLE